MKEEILIDEENLKSYEVVVPAVIKGGLNIFAETKEEAIKTALEIAQKDPAHVFDFHEYDLETLRNKITCEESEYC